MNKYEIVSVKEILRNKKSTNHVIKIKSNEVASSMLVLSRESRRAVLVQYPVRTPSPSLGYEEVDGVWTVVFHPLTNDGYMAPACKLTVMYDGDVLINVTIDGEVIYNV